MLVASQNSNHQTDMIEASGHSALPVSSRDDHAGRGPKDVFLVGQEVGDLVAGALCGLVRV